MKVGAMLPVVNHESEDTEDQPVPTFTPNDGIKFRVVRNDGDNANMRSLLIVKNIFAKQLPKMPKDYIFKTVFDRRHVTMLVISSDDQIIGGCCFRPFRDRGFSEIVFLAIRTSHQVKGNGGLLMNQLKELCKQHFGSQYFLTYADNFAVGYFERQGFSTAIQLPELLWKGYIKDYDGGTLMGCPLYNHIEYRDLKGSARSSLSSVVEFFRGCKPVAVYKPQHTFPIQFHHIDGLDVDNWKPSSEWSFRSVNLASQISALLQRAASMNNSALFLNPVNEKIAPGYFSVVESPMDLATLTNRNDRGAYKSKARFVEDARLISHNSSLYNGPKHEITRFANELVSFLLDGAESFVEYAH